MLCELCVYSPPVHCAYSLPVLSAGCIPSLTGFYPRVTLFPAPLLAGWSHSQSAVCRLYTPHLHVTSSEPPMVFAWPQVILCQLGKQQRYG